MILCKNVLVRVQAEFGTTAYQILDRLSEMLLWKNDLSSKLKKLDFQIGACSSFPLHTTKKV
jgi:hypothetical protein